MANFYERFSTAATQFAALPAIELQAADQLVATTYGELAQQAGGFAGWLHGQGVVADDRIAILADNDARWIAAYLGVLRVGAIAVPLDTAYKAGQVRTVIDNSGAKLIFTSARYLDRVRDAVSDWPGFVVGLLHVDGEGPGIRNRPGAVELAARLGIDAVGAGDGDPRCLELRVELTSELLLEPIDVEALAAPDGDDDWPATPSYR